MGIEFFFKVSNIFDAIFIDKFGPSSRISELSYREVIATEIENTIYHDDVIPWKMDGSACGPQTPLPGSSKGTVQKNKSELIN